MIGQVLAERYQILSRIGEGGMAVVFLAKDLRTGHDVAVKFLRPEFRENPDFLTRFQREATAASKMTHHNIVNLLDVGGGDEHPYIVIEYVDGKTLKDIIRERQRLPQEVACQIAIRILSALQHAHQAGIIHRDIKPQNILVNQKGYIKVSDFGIARMVGANTATIVDAENTVMGSVHYFSPEQARGDTATVLSDLYSVGVVLYEMLTGHVPFDGETSVAIALQHVQAKPRPVREMAPEVAPSVEAVVMQALEKEGARRFHTALEMAQALKIALQSPEKEITLDTPVLAMENGKRPLTASTRKRRLRERVATAAISLLVLAVLAVGSFVIYQEVVSRTRAPYVLHTMEQDARREIEKAGLRPEVARQASTEQVGMVIGVSHDFDYPMKRGDTLLITVSSGPSEQKAVPDVEDMLYEDAKAEAERVGLNLLQVDRVMNPARPGTVLSQQPERGTMMDFGGIVQVVISGGEVVVPDLVGQVYQDHAALITSLGLVVEKLEEVPMQDETQAGRVAAQQPQAGTRVMSGHSLNLSVYTLAPTSVPSPTPAATPAPAP